MPDQCADLSDDYGLLASLWQRHQAAEWPITGDVHEGELMTVDTVVAGCVTYYVEERELDDQREAILKDCLNDLEKVLPQLEPDSQDYFERLQQLGALILKLKSGT